MVGVESGLLSRIRASQERAVGSVVWDTLRTNAEHGRRNLLIHDGLVCRRRGEAQVIMIPADDDELKRELL